MQVRLAIWTVGSLITAVRAADEGPKALVIPASQYFEGNDGPWSTFDLRVGTPEQYIRVLASTASPQSMVPLDLGCTPEWIAKVPPDCAVSRGNLFTLNSSSTWRDVGTYQINNGGVGLEANLGYNLTAQWGLEHLGLGLTGPSLDNQTVAGFAAASPFYLGVFGLNTQPANFSSLGNTSVPSVLTQLKDQKKIRSLSWSFTAGARYRLKQVYGQLILSGYDAARFTRNTVSFSMAEDITRDLVVSLQSISYSGATSATLLSKSINIFIDSTDPNLWLPQEVCEAFEKAFGLTLDPTSNLYLVNDTHRDALLNSNAQVSFRISDVKAGGDTVTITLPYAAFDLEARYPLVENPTHYFPLKRASSPAQYTLGRVFLQEAYLIADYERKTFNVSACAWNQGAPEDIVTINDRNADTPTSGGGGGGSGNNNSAAPLSGGAIAGIVIGSLAGLALIVAGIILLLRKRRKWMKVGFVAAAPKPEPDDSVLNGEVFNASPTVAGAGHATPLFMSETSDPRSQSTSTGARSAAVAGAALAAGATSSGNEKSSGLLTSIPPAQDSSTPTELDGRETWVRPSMDQDAPLAPVTQLDIVEGQTAPVAQVPGMHELPGSAPISAVEMEGTGTYVGNKSRGFQPHRELAGMRISSSSEEGGSGVSSPLVSTIGADHDGHYPAPVSPTSPVHRRTDSRAF